MFNFFSKILIFLAAIGLYRCTDPIDLNIQSGTPQLAVDGMISDQSNTGHKTLPDTVRLTITNGYTKGPSPVVSNAVVIITDNMGNMDTLSYYKEGKYFTDTAKIKGYVGRQYELTVNQEGETYKATDVMLRTTVIDSLVSIYRETPQFGRAPGCFVDLFAKDAKGPGDFYRFKVYKNKALFNRPGDFILSADAGFSPNTPLDSIRFIFPIREGLNPNTTETDPETGGNKAPFVPGDVVTVEILSLSPASYKFFSEVQSQINNDGLFATPSFNVSTNFKNINPNSPKKAVGWFLTTSITSKSVTIKKKQ